MGEPSREEAASFFVTWAERYFMTTTDLSFSGMFSHPQQLVTSAQDLTAAWVDLGSEYEVAGARFVGVYVNLDINSSSDARIRFLGKHTGAHADEFVLPIRTVGASDVKVEDEYIEFNTDADQKMLIGADLDGVVMFLQVQVQAGTVGVTAGQIDDAWMVTAR